jgi:hypothetical protein
MRISFGYFKNKTQGVAGLLLMVALPVFMHSCEKVFMKDDARTDPVSIFEDVWSFTNDHYSFFDYKQIDWNEVYNRYRPLIKDGMNSVDLFDLCAAMLFELKDGHVNLISSFDRSRNWEWFLASPENFSYPIIERNYFKGRQRFIGPLEFINLLENDKIRDSIIYVYYGSFARTIGEGNLDIVIRNLDKNKGLILDVRNNGGGSIENARKLASRFTDARIFVGRNHVKTGPGHNDFRQEDIYIEPHNGSRFTGNIVVLTNRKSYSATTYFTQYMNALPNVTIIGDTTGGGGGMPAFRDLPNGWLLRVSSSRFLSPGGVNIESGIPPDIRVDMTEDSMAAGRDDILEKAIEILSGRSPS